MQYSKGLGKLSRKTRAYWAIVGSVLGFAFVPLTIELTASDGNPFYFNAFVTVSQTATLLVYLQFFARRTFPNCRQIKDPFVFLIRAAAPASGERRIHPAQAFRFLLLEGSRTYNTPTTATSASRIRRILFRVGWIGVPLVWLSLSRLEYAFFAWSADKVDAAISASLFRLWPLLMIFVLAKYGKFLRARQMHGDSAKYHISGYKSFLMSLTLVGAAFVIVSQSEGSALDIFSDFGAALAGVVLAVAAAFFAGISPACSLIFGDQMHRLYERASGVVERKDVTASQAEQLPNPTNSVDPENERLQRMWFAVFGHAISGIAIVPLNMVLGLTAQGYPTGLSFRAIIGGLIVGALLSGMGVLLLRVANTLTSDLGVNSVFYVMPLLSLLLLSTAGIEIPRMDLFIVGTTLVLALTILIESDPDETSDPEPLSESEYVRSRWGFSSLVLALWSFGTLIYLRDEILPEKWLRWSLPDYWGLVALSATIFALIFGFRVARLTSRITHEDEMMLRLFHRSKDFVDSGVLAPGVLDELQGLDVSPPKDLHRRYVNVRRHLVAGKERLKVHTQIFEYSEGQVGAHKSGGGTEEYGDDTDRGEPKLHADPAVLRSVSRDISDLEIDLDSLAHSKQQGRDFSELMSLTFFALITIALGLLARPAALDSGAASWGGFLTEAFTVFFVATIAFLAVNLFDIRKDREFRLIEKLKQSDMDFLLHFRYKPDLTIQRRVSVLVCAGVCASIVALLYDKWL